MIAHCSQSPFAGFPPEPLKELARLCRQICLRHEYQPGSCQRPLHEDLANALAIILDKHGTTAATAEDVQRLYAEEQQRLADATAVAEVIIAKLSASSAPITPPAPPSARPAPASPRPVAPRRPAAASSGTPGIADLLDGMLAQERSPRAS